MDDCIEWDGPRMINGYGRRHHEGRVAPAHRAAWIDAHGDPGDLFVCHHCDNRLCINVDHMFLGTHADNMRDMARKDRGSRTRLTTEQVKAIRASNKKNADLAKEYNVQPNYIGMLRSHYRNCRAL